MSSRKALDRLKRLLAPRPQFHLIMSHAGGSWLARVWHESPKGSSGSSLRGLVKEGKPLEPEKLLQLAQARIENTDS